MTEEKTVKEIIRDAKDTCFFSVREIMKMAHGSLRMDDSFDFKKFERQLKEAKR